jgi:hypothetical protein
MKRTGGVCTRTQTRTPSALYGFAAVEESFEAAARSCRGKLRSSGKAMPDARLPLLVFE